MTRMKHDRRQRIGIFTANLTTPGGSSRKGCLMAERLSERYDVSLISLDRPERRALESSFGVSLANVSLVCLKQSGVTPASWSTRITRTLPTETRKIVEQFPTYRRLRRLDLDLFMLNTSFHQLKAPAPKSIFMCMFAWPTPPVPQNRWYRSRLGRLLIDRALENTIDRYPYVPQSYDVITANSEFSAEWIKRRWNREAEVIYSATDLISVPQPGTKRNVILTAGRYEADKQQHILIEAFRAMSRVRAAGWELHLVGKVAESAAYFDHLKKLAEGLPIVFHHDASLDEMRRIYETSSIYWHVKGFNVPADEPQRMEHFGNTPIEAMSAGCVPVVFDAGGPRETVQHGVNGFRWHTIGELAALTTRLVFEDGLLAQMSQCAGEIDPRYGAAPFLAAVERIVVDLLAA